VTPSRLRPIAIAELRALAEGKHWQVEQAISALDTLTPVRGELHVAHHGTALEVSAAVETIVTLCCARCLGQFNQSLRADVRELIAFRGGPAPADGLAEVTGEELDDRLDPQGRFDPERWLFEQLSLRLPLVNRCGDACPGPDRWSSAPAAGDPRWASLKALAASAPTPEAPPAG
jgi:uncharacterized protein